jgi:RNA polymerase-binding transcription factor DksA
MDMEFFRAALMRKRGELLGGSAAKPLQWTMENNSGRQGDVADQAAGNNEVHVQLKLKQTDAKILQAIEGALRRLEEGT